ncbi:MAG: hypothetical protein M3418_02140 [Gemmatimonadota bacterium]|nr:hypothetical protein [Gemmatimonadota bacterium]
MIDEDTDYLTEAHVAPLRDLIALYDPALLPKRVKSAFFYLEYVAWTYYIDMRWPMLVTAAEALVHVSNEMDPRDSRRYAGSTRVFIDRMMGIQDVLGPLGFTEPELRAIYQERSGLAHGQDFSGIGPDERRRYRMLEEGMRAIFRSAIEDAPFRALFDTDAALQQAFPLR